MRYFGGLLALCFIVVAAGPSAAQPAQPADAQSRRPMGFTLVTSDPDSPFDKQRRWITAAGQITQETPEVFNRFLRANDIAGLTIYFDSVGGSIQGGLRLGDALRRAKARVSIGRSTQVGDQPAPTTGKLPRHELLPARGIRYSSCAYAFLGGLTRQIHPGAAYGVHMFWPGDQLEGLLSRNYAYADIERAQRISANIAAYIQRMGVDLQLLQLAAATPPRGLIRRLTAREILSLRVATLEFTPATLAGAGHWGVGIEQRQARLITSGNARTSSGTDIQFSIEAACAATPGFHALRMEVAPLERLNDRQIAFRRALLMAEKADAVLASSGKDIFAQPAGFPRRTTDSPTQWISATGVIQADVLNDAARPGGRLKLRLEDGQNAEELPIDIGNLPKIYDTWTAACGRVLKGGSALP